MRELLIGVEYGEASILHNRVDTVLVAVPLINVSQLGTLSYYHIMNS